MSIFERIDFSDTIFFLLAFASFKKHSYSAHEATLDQLI